MSNSSPKDDHGAIVVFVTASGEDEAANIARILVESRLAACVNMLRNVRSIYSWQGKIQDDQEVLMIIKTRSALFDALSAKVKEVHSYDVPEIIALPIVKGSPEYVKWLAESTG